MVVSNIFYFHPYLQKVSILTNILQRYMFWVWHIEGIRASVHQDKNGDEGLTKLEGAREGQKGGLYCNAVL